MGFVDIRIMGINVNSSHFWDDLTVFSDLCYHDVQIFIEVAGLIR